ncbi:MAG TPA: hypothetical protein VH497_19245 [Vicinamibacterales bacterium]
MSTLQRLSLVVYQDVPGVWVGRGIEHDLTAEGRSIGETVRALLRMIQAHTAFDARHDRQPLSAFRPAPQPYWNAFHAGTQVPLAQFGALAPSEWDVTVAIARQRPTEQRAHWPAQPAAGPGRESAIRRTLSGADAHQRSRSVTDL